MVAVGLATCRWRIRNSCMSLLNIPNILLLLGLWGNDSPAKPGVPTEYSEHVAVRRVAPSDGYRPEQKDRIARHSTYPRSGYPQRFTVQVDPRQAPSRRTNLS